MKNKIIILSIITILLSSCFNDIKKEKNSLDTNSWSVIENNSSDNKNEESNEINSWNTNSWNTNSWELNETNSWILDNQKNNVEEKEYINKEVKNNDTEDKEVKNNDIEDKEAKEDNTDKSIDELLKDFDEDLNIEEILWWA